MGRQDEGEELVKVVVMEGGWEVMIIWEWQAKVIMWTNNLVVLAGGKGEEVVLLMLDVAGVEDKQEGAELGVAVRRTGGQEGEVSQLGRHH